jgi:hypothetical protein
VQTKAVRGLAGLVRWLAVACLGLGAVAGLAQEPTKATKPSATKAPTLEEMLAAALKDNPDIRLCESKLHEAEAELNRTRLQVIQKITTLYYTIDDARRAVEASEDMHRDLAKAYAEKNGAVTRMQEREANFNLMRAKAELAKLEAEQPYLLGKSTLKGKESADVMDQKRLYATHLDAAIRAYEAYVGQAAYSAPSGGGRVPAHSIHDKIRKGLQTPVKLDYKEASLTEVVDNLQTQVPDIMIHNRLDQYNVRPRLTLHLKQPVQLSAALQLIQDTVDVPGQRMLCLIRDYGILVTWEKFAPPGAIFLEQMRQLDDAPTKKDEADRHPPKSDAEGTVREVDAKNGLVIVTVGADQGLRAGHTLEVYRLQPKPMYLGTIKIVQVQANEAVARPVKALAAETIRKGDRVIGKGLAAEP